LELSTFNNPQSGNRRNVIATMSINHIGIVDRLSTIQEQDKRETTIIGLSPADIIRAPARN